MLTLCYCPGACSMASHIVLEESGEKYNGRKIDLGKGEQRSAEYLKINPHGRVPALGLDNGEFISENTAILPFLGKRFNLWTNDLRARGADDVVLGWVASSVHPAHGHIGRPERYASDPRPSTTSRRPGRRTSTNISRRSTASMPEGMALRQVLGRRSLRLRDVHLGIHRELPVNGAEELHRLQGPHAASARRCSAFSRMRKSKCEAIASHPGESRGPGHHRVIEKWAPDRAATRLVRGE